MYTSWELVDTFPYKGFDARLSYTWDDIPIRDCFDDTCYNIQEMEEKVNSGEMYWIIARVQLFLDSVEISEQYLGGIYAESLDELKEYYLNDMLEEAYYDAQTWFNENKDFLQSYEFSMKD